MKILVIGSLPNPRDPIGGATILLKYLVDDLSAREDVVLTVVDTSGRGGRPVYSFLRLVVGLIRHVPRADVVSLHASTPKLPLTATFVGVLSWLFRRPLIVRKFGGPDYRDYAKGLLGHLCHRALKGADLLLVETDMLVRAAREAGLDNVAQYPNNRPMPPESANETPRRQSCRRFIFLGQVRPTKGVRELIEAGERLPEGTEVAVYGSLVEGMTEAAFEGLRRVRYAGTLDSDEVIPTVASYDALVLPTYYQGEGHPGVILEAFAAGRPVISTTWRAVPEIVDDSCGLLVEPRNPDALCAAMSKLVDDDELYIKLCQGAQARRACYDSTYWAHQFVAHCERALARRGEAQTA